MAIDLSQSGKPLMIHQGSSRLEPHVVTHNKDNQTPVCLQIRMFGPFDVHVHGMPLPALRTRKGAWLLALLVLNYPRNVERTWLASTLWPDSNDGQALRNLRTSLYDLRKALGDQGERLYSPTPSSIGIDLTQSEIDLLVFDASVAGKDPNALGQSVLLYRGCLLEGCQEEWVQPERNRREQACLDALERLAAIAIESGQLFQAVQHLRTCVRLEPMREPAHQSLMSLLATLGDYAGAIQVYREFRLRLHERFQAMPSADTTALYQQLRLRARQKASDAISVPVLNESLPPEVAPAPQDALLASHNLPRALTSFIGREQEIERLLRLLQSASLLTLTGAGGSGKTRLALQIAVELKENFPDGVWLIELASVADPRLILQAVASVLGLREQLPSPLQETILKALANRKLLLMLDNCEHLLAECAAFASALMRSCPDVILLVTSREHLGIAGEQTYRVPSLALPDLQRPLTVANLENVEAVRLFVERARISRPEFAIDSHNAAIIASLCHRLDGIPLALELAAARMRALSLEDIEARLDRRFNLLTGGDRSALPRHQTLRALIDWSYDLLNARERLLLQRLSVFPGGWSLEAAEQVASGEPIDSWEVLELLVSLVDKSLVLAEERDGWVRYRMFDTLRQYAAEKLESGNELEAVCVRRRDWYLKLTTDGFEALRLGIDHNYWIQRLESEHDNLRAVLAWPSSTAEGANADLNLAANMWRFWFLRGYSSEGREHLRRVLTRAGTQQKTLTRARALGSAANLADNQGDYASTWKLYEESLAIRQELALETADLKANRAIGRDFISLGYTAAKQGDTLKAREKFESSLTFNTEMLHIFTELGDRNQVAEILADLGLIALHLERYADSEAYHAESLSLYQDLNDKTGIGDSLSALGHLAAKQFDYAKARALLDNSLVLRKEMGNARGVAITYEAHARVAYLQCDYSGARSLYRSAVLAYKDLGDRQRVAICLEALAGVMLAHGDTASAVRRLGCAAALHTIIGTPVIHHERLEYERLLSQSRLELGEELFDIAWSEGQAITWEQIALSVKE